jgi:putative ATP-dependent endonuclease of the OLD family
MNYSILVDTARVSGFRGIRNLEIDLSRVTVLIGPNNSGKTSLLKALQLALGDFSRSISEEDFFVGLDEERAKEILVDVRFVPVDSMKKRTPRFDDMWATEFGDKIKAEANGNQFVALRTRVRPNQIKGGFDCTRHVLQTWSEFKTWLTDKPKEEKTVRFESTHFISIEAQRDLHYELTDRTSFAGRVLAGVEYEKSDIVEIEKAIEALNLSAVEKSEALKAFKANLTKLNQSFDGAGNVEITPFPKKLRDLSKHFSVHFGENKNGIFSMEYHGMGTRSWASMLAMTAFIESAAKKHEVESEPFFPILAVEEPEAHLHPNAQKTLYKQITDTNGQIIVSTHSPYFAAMADIVDIRSMRRDATGVHASKSVGEVSAEDKKKLSREITSKCGEILFARALVLCEGITEEQLIPALFEICEGKTLFNLGVCCVNVGGKFNYQPFLRLACSLGIPTFVVSDNDGSTKADIEGQITNLKTVHNITLGNEIFGIAHHSNGNDLEAELVNCVDLKSEIVQALILYDLDGVDNPRYLAAKQTEYSSKTDAELIALMRDAKASYAGFLAQVVRDNPNKKVPTVMTSAAIKSAISDIKKWLSL